MGKPLALIIDDHFDSGIIFSEALEWAGFEAEAVYSGEAALARLAVIVPDVVVLDMCLPRVAGTDILRRIRADARLAKTRVIIATADQWIADTLPYGEADVVLVKPIGFNQLLRVAASLVSGTRRDR
jgi:DNA-binding response OmpR family regulator